MEVRARGRTSRGGAWPTPNSVYFWFLIAYLSLSFTLSKIRPRGSWLVSAILNVGHLISFLFFFFHNTQWPFLFGCPDFMPEHRVRFISSKGPIVLHSEGNWWASQAGMRGGQGERKRVRESQKRDVTLYCLINRCITNYSLNTVSHIDNFTQTFLFPLPNNRKLWLNSFASCENFCVTTELVPY